MQRHAATGDAPFAFNARSQLRRGGRLVPGRCRIATSGLSEAATCRLWRRCGLPVSQWQRTMSSDGNRCGQPVCTNRTGDIFQGCLQGVEESHRTWGNCVLAFVQTPDAEWFNPLDSAACSRHVRSTGRPLHPAVGSQLDMGVPANSYVQHTDLWYPISPSDGRLPEVMSCRRIEGWLLSTLRPPGVL